MSLLLLKSRVLQTLLIIIMSLPMVQLEFQVKQSSLQLSTPPATSSPPPPSQPLRDGPVEAGLPPPQPARQLHEHVLYVQETAEDNRIRLRQMRMQRQSQEHSCIEDSETTP